MIQTARFSYKMDKHYKAKKIEYAHCDWICALGMHRHSIVSAGGGFFDRLIKVRTRSGRRLKTLKGHTGPVQGCM